MRRLKSREAKLLAQDHTASIAEVEFEPRAPTFKYCTPLPPDFVRNLSPAPSSLCDPWQEAELLSHISLVPVSVEKTVPPSPHCNGEVQCQNAAGCEQNRRCTVVHFTPAAPQNGARPQEVHGFQSIYSGRQLRLWIFSRPPVYLTGGRPKARGSPDSSKVTLSLEENSQSEALPPLWKVGFMVLRPRRPHPVIQELTSS